MELDHLFILTTPAAPEIAKLEAIGLTPTYRREHLGQGTANVCYCFENAFLEVLWVTSGSEARGPSVARMQLADRANWRMSGTNPFGIAWRNTGDLRIPTWPCRPPYLPPGVAIEVAADSDDLAQPLMFTFPGARAPREWPEPRRGGLQSTGGFSTMELRTVRLPPHVQPSATLRQVASACHAVIDASHAHAYALDVVLTRADGTPALRLRLPDCDVLA